MRVIDKRDFYHGAAIVSLLQDRRCENVSRERSGYLVDGFVFALLKYTTKSRTPWGFQFNASEMSLLREMNFRYRRVVVGLICGGDGICALLSGEMELLLGGKPGRVSTRRKFNERYAVHGSINHLDRKVSVQRWPSIVYEG